MGKKIFFLHGQKTQNEDQTYKWIVANVLKVIPLVKIENLQVRKLIGKSLHKYICSDNI